ncbi:hypothetical protein [Microbacterium panaciterrae]|uniref:Fimbrial assembly protein n=1 Tax=Microbacterium panaciterrae TaxID=985759 RepID=A0ABP8P509_9MICO
MARIAAVTPGGPPRVDLLPPSEIERREREALSAVWVRICLLAVLLAVVLVGATYAWKLYAEQNAAAEQARSITLIGQIGALSEVSKALATESELQNFRADAMGSDLAWTSVLDKARSVLPAGTTLVGFDLTPGADPGATTLDKDAAKKTVGLTGTLTIDSPNPVDLGPYARALRDVDGILTADASAAARSSATPGRYTYTVDITFDQTVYSGRFVKEATK